MLPVIVSLHTHKHRRHIASKYSPQCKPNILYQNIVIYNTNILKQNYLFKNLHPTSVFRAAYSDRIHYSDGIYLCKRGSLILTLHGMISDFNPVWSTYVSVSFPSTPVIITVLNIYCFLARIYCNYYK